MSYNKHTKYKTLPIGTMFEYNSEDNESVRLRVEETESCIKPCIGCYFYNLDCVIPFTRSIIGECDKLRRIDGKGIHYVKLTSEDCVNNNTKTIMNDKINIGTVSIDIPKGYVIDVEHSDFDKGIIKFKKKYITLDDIPVISRGYVTDFDVLTKIKAIAILMDIAQYYNGDWEPIWNDDEYYNNNVRSKYPEDDWDKYERCYYISNHYGKYYAIGTNMNTQGHTATIYFKNEEDAQAVIDNPNFRNILDIIYKD